MRHGDEGHSDAEGHVGEEGCDGRETNIGRGTNMGRWEARWRRGEGIEIWREMDLDGNVDWEENRYSYVLYMEEWMQG